MSGTDEIDDLKKKKLIVDEIKKGESDEKSIGSHMNNKNSLLYKKKNRVGSDKKIVNTRKEELCREKLYMRELARVPKTIRIPVYSEPCTVPKRNHIPRDRMTKDEWINFMSTPNRKFSPHFEGMKEKVLKTPSTRINELAQPSRQRMVTTLQDRGRILPAPLVDRLITVLEAESCLTPEQAEKLFRGKRKKKKRKTKKIPPQKKSGRSIVPHDQQLTFDKDATICQYLMAENFVKSILQWECTIPKEEFEDIAEVIFDRLKRLFHCTAVDEDERSSQQMHILAEIVASWIAGVLFDVGEKKQDELEKEHEEKQKVLHENVNDDDDSTVSDTTISDNSTSLLDDEDENDDIYESEDDDNDDESDNSGENSSGYRIHKNYRQDRDGENEDNEEKDDEDQNDEDEDENDENKNDRNQNNEDKDGNKDDKDQNNEDEDENGENKNDRNQNNDEDGNKDDKDQNNEDEDGNGENENDEDGNSVDEGADDNGSGDRSGDHYNNNKRNNGNELQEMRIEENHDKQINIENSSKVTTEKTKEQELEERSNKLHSEAIKQITQLNNIPHSVLISKNERYQSQKLIESQNLMALFKSINQHHENPKELGECNVGKSDMIDYPSYSFAEREIKLKF